MDTLEINIRGRVAILGLRHGVTNPHAVTTYARAVTDAVRAHFAGEEGVSLLKMEPVITEQLVYLESAIVSITATQPEPKKSGPFPELKEMTFDDSTIMEEDEPEIEEVEVKDKKEKRPVSKRKAERAKSMEEKLQDQRTPVKDLLKTECVTLGLLNKKQAEKLGASMVGKKPEDAEAEIMIKLRELLLGQVKDYIRDNKGGPWNSVYKQEEMRMDIQTSRSVRSLIMLTKQIGREVGKWEKDNGGGGLWRKLGMKRGAFGN